MGSTDPIHPLSSILRKHVKTAARTFIAGSAAVFAPTDAAAAHDPYHDSGIPSFLRFRQNQNIWPEGMATPADEIQGWRKPPERPWVCL
jgi:hypothetical protein